MKNHELHSISFQPFLEANANTYTNNGRNRGSKRGRDYYSYDHRHIGQWNNKNRCSGMSVRDTIGAMVQKKKC